jgi:A/G-specific adenine glycosylase
MVRAGKKTSTRSAELPSVPQGLSRKLVAWFRTSARDLPWRRTRDPYAIWVSEVMLQQTQVTTVIPYYQRFMQRFPNVTSLARADEDDVLHAWQGLGYYSRARGLRAGARAVVEHHRGRIPRTAEALRTLPGIGPYTAGAIASIAFDERAAVVDGNVTRVLSRLFALEGDATRAPLKQILWDLALGLVPREAPGDLNQALMELGATVCTPRQPLCPTCPVARDCRARREGRVDELPTPKRRPAPTSVHMAAAVAERAGRVLVVKLPADAPRWAGMWIFPMVELDDGEAPERGAERAARELAGLRVRPREALVRIQHGVTRYRITLDAVRCTARAAGSPRDGGALAWTRPDELAGLALPAAHRRIARALVQR